MSLIEINKRYSKLSGDNCCLSCGGAVHYAKAQEGEVCLDLGCGRGTDAIRLCQEVGEKGFVYGIDIADGMIDKARVMAAKLETENVSFIKADLENLPLPDKSIDLVISNCTINHAGDKQKVWNEIARILKPGGRFVVSDIYSLAEVPQQFKNDPVAVSECWGGAVTRSDYISQLGSAGFRYIEILEESDPYSKGEIEVCSFTIRGKLNSCSCCS